MNDERRTTVYRYCKVASLLLCGTFIAQAQSDSSIRSHLTGQVTVSAEVDSTQNYEGFEIIVVHAEGGQIDTLGYAETDREGRFATEVRAPQRGIYALVVKRLGSVLSTSEIAVADGDSARMQAQLPLLNRPPRVISLENAAWMAYKNTEAQHNQALVEMLQGGQVSDSAFALTMQRTAGLFWGFQDTFPGTIGANLAAVKAVTLLDGWNDSLVVAWHQTLDPRTPGYVEAVRAARRAQARLAGQEAALALLNDAMSQTDDPVTKAALQATVVQAHLDSLESDAAVEAARRLQDMQPGSVWDVWAQRAEYEAQNLMPGMPAPEFEAATRGGETVALARLKGKPVVLEFWEPQGVQNMLEQRTNAIEAYGDQVTWISVIMESDTDLIDAVFEGRDLQGLFIQASERYDDEIARAYNVNALPMHYLIDAEGRLVGKYLSGALTVLAQDLDIIL